MSIINKVKENLRGTAVAAREGVEDLQTNHELGQAYGELGRRAFDLIDGGKLESAELDFDVKRIRTLRAALGTTGTPAAS